MPSLTFYLPAAAVTKDVGLERQFCSKLRRFQCCLCSSLECCYQSTFQECGQQMWLIICQLSLPSASAGRESKRQEPEVLTSAGHPGSHHV